jgi:hypothetical protein
MTRGAQRFPRRGSRGRSGMAQEALDSGVRRDDGSFASRRGRRPSREALFAFGVGAGTNACAGCRDPAADLAFVIPAKAEIQGSRLGAESPWIPAFAGMTEISRHMPASPTPDAKSASRESGSPGWLSTVQRALNAGVRRNDRRGGT